MRRLPYEAKTEVWKRCDYRPTPLQVMIHKSTNLTDLVSGGWRAGKSVVIAAEATPHCLIPSPRPYLIALIGPTYTEPRAEFDYIVEFLTTILPSAQFNREKHVSRPKEGSCEFTIPAQRVRKEGGETEMVYYATVRTYTAAEVENIRSFNADAVIICEAGGVSREGFYNIMGRVLSTGGFILGSGTLEFSQKWYHNLIKTGLTRGNELGVHSFILPTWANTVMFPGGEEDEKIERLRAILPRELFDVRVGAKPVRLTGIAVKEASLERNVDDSVKFNPSLPVELAIDPGYARAFAVLAIQIQEDGEIHIIDEVYERFAGVPEIVEICKQRPWWQQVDAHNPGVVDRAAKQHQSATGDSVIEKWDELTGQYLDLTEAVIPVDDGLMTLRAYVKMGIVKIAPACRGILAEWDLGDFPETMVDGEPWQYRKDSEGRLKGDNAMMGDDHASTALIYWLVRRYGFVSPEALDYTPSRLLSVSALRQVVGGDDYGPAKYGVRAQAVGRMNN